MVWVEVYSSWCRLGYWRDERRMFLLLRGLRRKYDLLR